MTDDRSHLAEADTATLETATHADLIQLIEWMRATRESDRAATICQAYTCGVLDERQGRIPRPTPE
jgi:hypothetical protein